MGRIYDFNVDGPAQYGMLPTCFASKEDLFEAASFAVLERWGQMIDRACAGLSDPAEVLAVSFRLSARLGWTHPEIAQFVTGAGLDCWTHRTDSRPARSGTLRRGRRRGVL